MSCRETAQKATQRASERLRSYTREGELFERLANNEVRCHACAHRCRIAPGKRGVCFMRENREGALYVPTGYVAGLAVDPIEKKPLFHVLPGSEALSFGMLGCNLRCDFCQNWRTSQTLRDPLAVDALNPISAQAVVGLALERATPVISSTYNEPLITSEWAAEIMRLGKDKGIRGAYVSNGFATTEVLEYLRPVLDIYKIDLKTFQDANYRKLGGALQPVLDTIAQAHRLGFWVEVVTLVIPGFNDSDAELRDIAQFVAGISRDIPWHVTAFHPEYKHKTGERPASAADIARAAESGAAAGIKFVYAGNLRGTLRELENTRCPRCQTTLVTREGYFVGEVKIARNGSCPHCAEPIPGIWA